MEGHLNERLQEAYEKISEDIGQTDILSVLDSAANFIASAICPGNEQYVVERIDQEENTYTIIRCWPDDTTRHAMWDVGHLYMPTEKTALVKAIERQKVVVIDDALSDPGVEYMRDHARNKGIKSLVVIPIVITNTEWLIIIDKAGYCDGGFTSLEKEYFNKYSRLVSKLIKRLIREERIHLENGFQDQKDAFSCIRDMVLNPFTSLMLSVKRIVEKAVSLDDNFKKLGEIAINDGRKFEAEFARATSMVKFLDCQSVLTKIKVKNLLNSFEKPANGCGYSVTVDGKAINQSIKINTDLALFVIELVKEYMECNGNGDKQVNLSCSNGDVVFAFKSYGFQPFKMKTDLKLFIISKLVMKLQGIPEILEHEFRITLPLNKTTIE